MHFAIVTTSLHASDGARSLGRLLGVVIPKAIYVKRGKLTISSLLNLCKEKDVEFLTIINSRSGSADKIDFFFNEEGEYTQDRRYIQIYEFMDPKMFNIRLSNIRGPLIAPIEFQEIEPDLTSLFEKYFRIVYSREGDIELHIDPKKGSTYLKFSLVKSQRRFAMLRITLKYY